MRFRPDRRHGALFDADGNVVFRFADFDTDVEHVVPDYVDVDRGATYVDGPAAHGEAGLALEAAPGGPDLPDPAAPQ